MNNQEIEIKLNYNDINLVKQTIQNEFNASKRKNVVTIDKYFSKDYDDMSNAHDLIRIREIQGEKNELTFKGDTKDNDNIWTRSELTTKVSSPKTLEQILINLGFKIISENECSREYWYGNDLEFVFANFKKPTKLEFLEIEAKNEKIIDDATKKLSKITTRFGEEGFDKFDKTRDNQ